MTSRRLVSSSQQQPNQSNTPTSNNWFLNKIQNFHQAHERLKHTVHTAWRYPLPRWGRWMMGGIYFSIPVVIGYGLFQYLDNNDSKSKAIENSRIPNQQQPQHQEDEKVKIGAGGCGGVVHLVTSDTKTEEINRLNLERFLRKQRKILQKEQQRQQQAEKENTQGNNQEE